MVELVVIIIILIVIDCVKIHRATQRQAAREREYMEEREMCGCTGFCLAYAIIKTILILIAAGAVFYIFVSLAIGETIGPRHLASSKFWIIAIASTIMLLPTVGIMIMIFYQKNNNNI